MGRKEQGSEIYAVNYAVSSEIANDSWCAPSIVKAPSFSALLCAATTARDDRHVLRNHQHPRVHDLCARCQTGKQRIKQRDLSPRAHARFPAGQTLSEAICTTRYMEPATWPRSSRRASPTLDCLSPASTKTCRKSAPSPATKRLTTRRT